MQVTTDHVREVLSAHWHIAPSDDLCCLWYDELECETIRTLADVEEQLWAAGAFIKVEDYQRKFLCT